MQRKWQRVLTGRWKEGKKCRKYSYMSTIFSKTTLVPTQYLWWLFLVVNLSMVELQPRNGGHTCETFSAWFKVSESTSCPDVWSGKTCTFVLDIESERFMPLILVLKWGDSPLIYFIPASGRLCKDIEEGNFCSLPTCHHLTSISIPSLTSETSSLGLQHIQKTNWHLQLVGLSFLGTVKWDE